MKWAVGGIARDVGEKGFLAVFLLLDPSKGLSKKNIGAVSLGLYKAIVVFDDRIEITGSGSVALAASIVLTNTAGPMDKNFIKPAVLRLIGIFITQMPFTKNAGGVTGRFEDLCNGGGFERHPITLENRMCHPIFKGCPPRHQSGPSGCAGGTGMEVGKPSALSVKLIEMGSFEKRMPMTTQVAIALIIGLDQDDVRFLLGGYGYRSEKTGK